MYDLFSTRGLPPHGYCLLWDPHLIALHVVSDALIGLAYFSIPIALSVVVARRRDIEFGWLLLLFAVFITACGATHFMSILVLWVPAYGLEGVIKAVTAVSSVLTAIAMWPLLPKIIALPSPTQLQQANQELRLEAEERARVEDQLRQSQKLEAIGRLTGGIAHDFNNLLTVIMGNIDRAQRRSEDPERVGAALDYAMEASQRAAKLTDQLLTYGRKRAIQVERHDLNQVVSELAPLIAPTIGENVALSLELLDAPLSIEVDKIQFETAILNICANACDAMPHGGSLVIETRAIASTHEVSICLRDSGTGMDERTLEQAIEPFFTTKPIGEGTGLGLSQAHGFANQAGGRLLIESLPGEGTSVTIVLPSKMER